MFYELFMLLFLILEYFMFFIIFVGNYFVRLYDSG